MSAHKIAVIAGDGIGQEVVPAAIACLERIAEIHSLKLDFTYFGWGSEHYVQHGRMMPVDGLAQLAEHHAIFLGAVGSPDVADTESLWGLLIPIRREFQQYVNLRPVKSLDGVTSPLVNKQPIDLLIVRENNEGEYSRSAAACTVVCRRRARYRKPSSPDSASPGSPATPPAWRRLAGGI
jgi:tartrate dehydrogenase/decarboxylase / D-malate dehydrogenase